MRRALVTGATGFIGRHLVAQLAAEGWAVTCVARGPLRAAPSTPGSMMLELGPAPWSVESLKQALEASGPEVVFHMAGTTRTASLADLYAVNTGLAATLFDAVEAHTGTPQPNPLIVLAGSAAEYGEVAPDALPVAEGHPCAPSTDYGVSKYAQTLVGLARARRGLNVMVARIFNPIGPGMPSHLALASFAQQLRLGVTAVRVGDLDVERDFIDVSEAARLVVALSANPPRRDEHNGIVWNICSGRALSVRDLVDELVRLCGRSVTLEIDPARLRPGQMRSFHGSTARLAAVGLFPQAPEFATLLPLLLADRTDHEQRGSGALVSA
jgi:nucleoside-diphosphate-sugar epimerase